VGRKRWAEGKGGFVCRLSKETALKIQSCISAEVWLHRQTEKSGIRIKTYISKYIYLVSMLY